MSRTPRQRYKRKLLEAEAVERVIPEPTPYTPSPEFERAYSVIGGLGPIGMIWRDGERFPSWALGTNPGRVVGGVPRNRF
jgi:hypothetical protein